MMKINVGFVGLGDMGFPIAKNLVGNDFEAVVFDVRPEALKAISELGATAAASNREVGEKCEIIGICVQDDAQVEAVMLDDDGILKGAKPETIVAIHSTVHPETVRKLAEIAGDQGVGVIDVAVTGGAHVAEQRALCYMAGGEEQSVERCRKVFETSASKIVYAGDLGMGMMTKLCNNLITYMELLGATEGALLARKAGVPDEAIDAVTEHNGVVTPAMKMFIPMRREADKFVDDKGFQDMMRIRTQIGEKDLALAVECARELGVSLPGTGLCQQLMARVFGLKDPDRR
jgi:3-hydroxyisobutyrate dehydrogenase